MELWLRRNCGPTRALVWLTSALLTVLSAVGSPISMLAPTDVSGNTCEVRWVTSLSVAMIFCTSVTPIRTEKQ